VSGPDGFGLLHDRCHAEPQRRPTARSVPFDCRRLRRLVEAERFRVDGRWWVRAVAASDLADARARRYVASRYLTLEEWEGER
jgi:hypothetical protein